MYAGSNGENCCQSDNGADGKLECGMAWTKQALNAVMDEVDRPPRNHAALVMLQVDHRPDEIGHGFAKFDGGVIESFVTMALECDDTD